ncbi:MAG: double-strand break repair helicase AddA [Rubricella sp.]
MMNSPSAAQNAVSDPAVSSWVSANAGSGKTRVLTDRVARLLLAGTEPEQILCLTYTKAAAAEMQNRLFERLGEWSMLEDGVLRQRLEDLGEAGRLADGATLSRARTLFAKALETPGGLKIQTIHAFCAALLRQFPLEAGVSPAFRELDDRSREALLAECLDRLATREDPGFASLLRKLHGTTEELGKIVEGVLRDAPAFAEPFDEAALSGELGADGPAPETIASRAMTGPTRALLVRLREAILSAGKETDTRQIATLDALLASDGVDLPKAIVAFSHTGNGEGTPHKRFPTKDVADALPSGGREALASFFAQGSEIRDALGAREALENAKALHAFGRAFLAEYRTVKEARGFLDFDDLIARARHLVRDAEATQWVLYKLDGRVSHILLDEAQDTAPGQWAIVEAIASEFFSGKGAQEERRTLFVVGDEKQSIYSFQGAAPQEFQRMRAIFGARIGDAGETLRQGELAYSFRSSPVILRAVDAVMQVQGRAGLDALPPVHLAFHDARPGRVELHPFEEDDKAREARRWDEPLDEPAPGKAAAIIAGKVADRIGQLLAEGTVSGENGPRKVMPGDILVLVRRRKDLFDGIIRALKLEGIPVAGADRLKLTEELAVRDLLAALRVAVSPHDDFSLAALLRSPLMDVDEDGLYRLAHGRDGATRLIARVRAAGGETADRIQALLDEADFLRPFEMLDLILTRLDGRRRLIARLGTPAIDAIDELMSQAIAYEGTEAPTITGFLDWIEATDIEVKREQDARTEAVRVMTVHGAKGLEAPVVILPETGPMQNDRKDDRRVATLPSGRPAWLKGEKALLPPALGSAKDDQVRRNGEEAERLLYVAMTRAESHLIVFGGGGRRPSDPSSCWHGLIEEALRTLPEHRIEGDTVVLQSEDWPVPAPEGGNDNPGEDKREPIPDFAARPPGPPPRPVRPIVTPTALSEGLAHALPLLPVEGDDAPLLGDEEDATLRGTAIHRLLEYLPGVAPNDRANFARALLPSHDPGQVALWCEEAAAVIDDPAFAGVFGPGSFAEAAFAVDLGEKRLAGRIDRLVISPDRVRAIDFKTNRTVPPSPDQIPEGILVQLGAYAHALREQFPKASVETAIVWTVRPLLMPVPTDLAIQVFATRHARS